MAATSDIPALLQGVITAIQSLQPFPQDKFMDRLMTKTIATPTLAVFRSHFDIVPSFGPGPNDPTIDNIPVSAPLSRLAVQSIVSAIGQLDNSTDKPNFRACVQAPTAAGQTAADIERLTGLFFAEHINWHLTEKAVPTLAQLFTIAGFKEALAEKLMNTRFINGEIATDLARGGEHIFSLALLFICEYLQFGPGFTALAADAFKNAVSCQVLMGWATELLPRPQADTKAIFASLVRIASMVMLNPEGSAPAVLQNGRMLLPLGPTFRMKKTVMEDVFQPAMLRAEIPPSSAATLLSSGLANDDIEEYRTITSNNQAQWAAMQPSWIKPVAAVAVATTQSTKSTFNDFGRGFIIGITLGMEDHQEFDITTWTGQGLADWISQVRGTDEAMFTTASPTTVSVEHKKVDQPASCFIAGTKISTSSGLIAIEDITEGTHILTEATSSAFGVASDEEVVSYLSSSLLIGFNNEGTFVTPGHIFHTTTGPRAMEPALAKLENSWVKVGRLQTGHVLYRMAKDGKSYDLVEICSIQVDVVQQKNVYGVHLREGARSYHANGYLVAVNYPEITIKSVSRALLKLPRHERVKMLTKIEELSPIFGKIGIQGVSDVLRKEIRGKWRSPLANRPKHVKKPAMNLADFRRSFRLEARDSPMTDKNGPAGYKLPIISIYEGVLRCNLDIVPRVEFDSDDHCVRWSRKLDGELGYEHGILSMTSLGLTGQGAVLVSPQENPTVLPDTLEHVVPFVAEKADNGATAKTSAATPSTPAPAPVTASAPVAALAPVAAPAPIAAAAPIDAPAPIAAPAPITATAPIDAPASTTAPAPIDAPALSAASAPDSASALTTTSAPDVPPMSTLGMTTPLMRTHTVPDRPVPGPHQPMLNRSGPITASPTVPVIDTGFIDNEDFWDVVVDQSTWPKDTVRTAAVSPVSLGQIAMGTYHTSAQGGMSIPTIVVPFLDQLLQDVNKGRTGDAILTPFYEASVLVNNKGTLTGRVNFKSASAVMSLSDQAPLKDEDPIAINNLTFKAVNSNVKIPILFSMCEFAFSWDFMDISGAMYELDPTMTGCIGNRHYLGTPSGSGTPSFLRANVAMAVANARTMAHPQKMVVPLIKATAAPTPAPVTRVLAAASALTLDGIKSIPGYSEEAVHTASQTTLNNMLLYHMKDSDRITFLSYPKPTTLPSELADNLPQALKDWIKTTYATAYISFMISQVKKGDTKGWQTNFTDEQKDKVWYWWSGAGPNCLSKSKEYQTINELTSAAAMQQLYGKTITPYLAEGSKWAGQLLTGWSNPHALFALTQTPINDAGVNLLNMYCNILHALDPKPLKDGGYADTLFMAVFQYASSRNLQSTSTLFNDPTGEENRSWLYDGMAELIRMALSNDPSLNPSIREDLNNDLAKLQADMSIDQAQDAKTRANQMLAKMNFLITNMSKFMASIGKGLGILWAKSGWSLSGAIFDKAAAMMPATTPFRVALAKGICTVALAGLYIFAAIATYKNWDNMDPTQKAQSILQTLKWSTDLAGTSIDIYKEYKEGSAKAKAAGGERLDQKTATAITSEEGKLQVTEASDLLGSGNPRNSGTFGVVENVSDGLAERGYVDNDSISDSSTVFNKPVSVPKAGRSPTMFEKFNTPTNWVKTIAIALSIAIFVCMTISLVNNWGNLNDAGKALGTIQLICTFLSIAVDVAMLAGSMVAAESAMMLVALPIVGAVLAVIGLVIALVMMFIDTSKPTTPPPSPVDIFIAGATPTVNAWDAMPKTGMTYEVPATVKAGTNVSFEIKALNKSGMDLVRQSVQITVQGGTDETCLLTALTLTDKGVLDVAASLADNQVAAVAISDGPPTAELSEALTTTQRTDVITSYQAIVKGVSGPANLQSLLTFHDKPAAQGFSVVFRGIINSVGSNVVQAVETLTTGDKCRYQVWVSRE